MVTSPSGNVAGTIQGVDQNWTAPCEPNPSVSGVATPEIVAVAVSTLSFPSTSPVVRSKPQTRMTACPPRLNPFVFRPPTGRFATPPGHVPAPGADENPRL